VTRIVLLDSGPLGLLVHPQRGQPLQVWIRDHARTGTNARHLGQFIPTATWTEIAP
jgi:hypothetical protein